jgi:uncharacterized phage infection (PIP) family protein YhgE
MVVASLVASVVFFNMATMPINYRAWYEQEKQAYKNLEAKSTELAAALARKNDEVNQTRQGLSTQLAEARQERDAAQARVKDLTVQLGQSQNQLSSISSKLTEVEKTLASQQETTAAQGKSLQEAYDRLNKASEERAILADSLKEAQKQNELLNKSLVISQRNLENEKASAEVLSNKLRDLERIAPDAVRTAETDPIAPPGIAGTVTAVSGNLASVNVGSAHGVKEGMRLIVYRGDQFVGHLKVEQVEVNEAAGMVINKRLDPIQGDRVTSPTAMNGVN